MYSLITFLVSVIHLLIILLLFPSFFSHVLLWLLCAGFLFIIHH